MASRTADAVLVPAVARLLGMGSIGLPGAAGGREAIVGAEVAAAGRTNRSAAEGMVGSPSLPAAMASRCGGRFDPAHGSHVTGQT